MAVRSILDETYLKDEDKIVLAEIILKIQDYNKENNTNIELYLTGSSLADSEYNDVDLVVVSPKHKEKELALLVGKWVDGEVFPRASYSGILKNESYHGPHPFNCYRISVSQWNIGRNSGLEFVARHRAMREAQTEVSSFDITAGKTLERCLASRERKHLKLTS